MAYFKPKKSLLVKEFSNALNISNIKLNTKLHIRKSKAVRHPFTDVEYNETSYYFQNGLRKVYPYYFSFKTFTKARWCGKRILDVFGSEFRVKSEPIEDLKWRIKEGMLTVNNEKVSIDYALRFNDFMSSTVHRHELPVKSDSIAIIHEDEDKIVINKPASIPVHPCGRYRHNSILFILAKEYNFKNLLTIHRLDRLTSGILIFGRNVDKTRSLSQEFYDHRVMKEYVCRVDGDFPNGVTICEEPIEINRQIGISKVSPNGKYCKTVFEKISYNGRTSLLVCRPMTGRSHQIRVHLQYLGFPVVKDPLYNPALFGPEKDKGGKISKSNEQLTNDIFNMEKHRLIEDNLNDKWVYLKDCLKNRRITSLANGSENNKTQYSSANFVESLNSFEHSMSYINSSKETVDTAANMLFNPCKMIVDENCSECKTFLKDPAPAELVICLHAWKYKGPGWSYETELPVWTEDEWNE